MSEKEEKKVMGAAEMLAGLPRASTGTGTAVSPLGAVDRAGRPEIYRVSSRTYRIEYYFVQARKSGMSTDGAIKETAQKVYVNGVRPRKGVSEEQDVIQHLNSLRFKV
jgi:hypothetical protein